MCRSRQHLLIQREGLWPVACLFSGQDLVLGAGAPLAQAEQTPQAIWLFQLAVHLLQVEGIGSVTFLFDLRSTSAA